MECRNDLCVYYFHNRCILDEIGAERPGRCDSRVRIVFTEEELSAKREEVLECLERDRD